MNISISKSERFVTQVYRKPTNTNVLLNFQAIAPDKWKKSVLRCFLNRAYKLCSTEDLFNKEVITIRNTFKLNGYPTAFIDSVINTLTTELDNNINQDKYTATVSKDNNEVTRIYMVLP